MRLTPPRRSPYPWLTTLKVSQLQHIAQATGIQSSGPKAALLTRLNTQLPQYELPGPFSTTTTTNSKSNKPLRILSIDMGIRNLAYAHLHVSDADAHAEIEMENQQAPATLTAWRRLAVSNLSTTSSLSLLSHDERCPDGDGNGEVRESFSPAVYARAAYVLITTLLARYAPTHVLIERQRFRSGGASAVQEWTLRVGVFEGMLYAVLVALRGGGVSGEVSAPVVVGVEPGRVGRYWEGRGTGAVLVGAKREGDGGRKRKGAREGKKMKIDLVGEWLSRGDGTGNPVVVEEEEGEVREVVDAYLDRWEGKGKKRRKAKGEAGEAEAEGTAAVDVRKMDDLADCLVQGVTWLQWQTMRRRIAMMGLDALPELKK